MPAFSDILSALDKNTMLLDLPTAWINKKFIPKNKQLYIRTAIIPAQVQTTTVSGSGDNLNIGIYQVDVFAPIDGGKGEALTVADAVADSFDQNVISYNGQNVRIVSSSIGSGRREGAWFVVPVFISYKAYTQAR